MNTSFTDTSLFATAANQLLKMLKMLMVMTDEQATSLTYCVIALISLTLADCVVIENFYVTNNKTPIKGDAIQLTCKYNENGGWTHNLNVYNPEGSPTVCICYPSQGCNKPRPSIHCSMNETALKVLVDINPLNDSSDGDWKCEFDASFKEVNLLVSFPVTSVTITSPSVNPVPVTENQPAEFQCTTSVERPRSTIQWYFENNGSPLTGGTVSSSIDTALENTVGTLSYRFDRSDNGKELYCTARNIDGRIPVTSNNSKQISVRYSPDAGPFIVNYTNSSTYKMIQAVPQTLICYVTGGNPTPSLTWNCYFGSQVDISGSGEVRKRVLWTTSNQSPGTCTCTMDQVVSGKQSVFLNIQVLYPPTIPKFYANGTVFDTTLREIQGRSVEIVCSSSSRPSPLSYQWTKTQGRSVSNSAVLNLVNVQASSVGPYRCNVSNTMKPSVGNEMPGSSTAYFSLVMLSPPTLPVLSYKSESVTNQLSVVQGDNVTLSCTSSSEPLPSYSWTGPKKIGNSQMIMNNIQTSKTGTYTCNVTNNMNATVGPVVVGHSQAVINITVMKGPTIPSLKYLPQLGTSKDFSGSTLAVIIGTSFSIKCYGSSSIPNPLYNWTGLVTSITDTVRFNNISTNKHGNYTCHVTNLMDRTVGSTAIGRNSKQLAVNVLYPPEITSLADRNLTEYEDLNILCSANSNPSPKSYSWTRSKDNFRQTSPSLTKTNVTRHDTAVYTCTVRNQMVPTISGNIVPGEKSISVSIRVLYHLDVTISQPNGTDIKEGDENVVLLCNADGDPNSFIFTNWTQYAPDGKTIVKEYKPIEGSVGEVVLTFPTVSYMDSGIFEIQASNGVPEHQTAELYATHRVSQLVKGKPVITEHEDDVTAATEKNATLTFVYYSNDGSEPKVQWYKVENATSRQRVLDNDRIHIQTGFRETNVSFHSVPVPQPGNVTKLVITNVQASDFGVYEVEIKNEIGFAEVKRTSFVAESAPGPPTEFKALQSSATRTGVTVTWVSGFHGGADQTFYVEYNTTTSPWQFGVTVLGGMQKESNFTVTLEDLASETQYFFRIYAKNKFGKSDYVICAESITTQSEKQPIKDATPIGAAVGGGVGGAVIIAIVAVIIFMKRRKSTGVNKKKTLLDENKSNGGTGVDNDFSEVNNPAYVSADEASTSRGNDVCAVVNKSNKQTNLMTTNNAADLYTEVKKPKKGKSDRNDGPSTDIYAKPVKPKVKQVKEKKQKHGKKTKDGKHKAGIQGQVNDGLEYENVDQLTSDGTEAENEYELTQCSPGSSKPSRVQNEEGLTYVTVDFPQTRNGTATKPFIIRGIDEKNEYADIAFGKVGEPAPENDDEDKAKGEKANDY